jgi:dynein heavy chain
MEEPLIQKRI